MKRRRGLLKSMTSLIPWDSVSNESVIDNEKRVKVNKEKIIWVHYIPEEDKMIIKLGEQHFTYPSLDDLRLKFKETGLYTEERINEIIKVYERLPKYRARGSSASRSKK